MQRQAMRGEGVIRAKIARVQADRLKREVERRSHGEGRRMAGWRPVLSQRRQIFPRRVSSKVRMSAMRVRESG